MAFKEIFIIVALVHAVGAVTVKNCDRGKKMGLQVQWINFNPSSLSKNVKELDDVKGRVKILRTTTTRVSSFKYQVKIEKKIGNNRYNMVNCPSGLKMICGGWVKCTDIAKNLKGAKCNRGIEPVRVLAIKEGDRDLPREFQTLLRSSSLKKGQYKVTARLLAKGKPYACVEMMVKKKN